ncbi:MAG: DUF3987 domain-containing protein [Dechloromonas sp.]|nr:MAG: DUF3987 domain-containing protein [Dechloromonas sp.]
MNALYPLPVFPSGVFPYLIEDALLEVTRFVQAPMPMTASSFLSVMSAVVQRVADVRLPIGSIRPTSLFTLTIAESGERKSTVDDLVAKPLRKHDAVTERRYIEQRQNFEKEFDRWQVIRIALMRGMAKLAGKGEPTAGIEQKLADHDAVRPIPPRLRRIMRQDMTHAAIMDGLEGEMESISSVRAKVMRF